MFQDGHHAERRTRNQSGIAEQQAAEIQRVERVDVLGWIDGLRDGLGRDRLRKRKLDEDSVHRVVAIEPVEPLEQHLFAGRFGQQDFGGGRANARAGSLLALDVGTARGIVTDQYDGQLWRTATRGRKRFDLEFHFIA